MLETLVGAALMCGSLSLLIILFTKVFMRSESYDDMLAKRRKQENEILGPKPSKKDKTKKEKSKVKKMKPLEDVVKPKAEVKPMMVEEEVAPEDEEVEEVEEMVTASEAQREAVTSRRNKKKNRKWKNVSFSDEGESLNGAHEMMEVKPILVNKDERTPVLPQAEQLTHIRRPGKDVLELKREHEVTNGAENGVSKKKKKKSRAGKAGEEETTEKTSIQQSLPQSPVQQIQNPLQSQTSHLPSQPSGEPVIDVVEKTASPVVNTEATSKKKKKTEKRADSAVPVKASKENAKDPNGIGEEAHNLIRVVDLTPMNPAELKAISNILVGKGALSLTEPDESVLAEMRNLRATEATLRKELLSERSHITHVTNTAKERMAGQNAKIMELQQELNRTGALTQESRQLREDNERMKANLKELESRMKIITDQFALNASQLDTTERAKKALEVQVERQRDQLKTYEKRLHEGSAHLADQLTATKTACASAEREVHEVRRELESANSALTFERSSAQERVTSLEREVSSLQMALQASKADRRGAAEGQEDPVQRSAAAAAAAAASAAGPRMEQLEKSLKEKESKIADLETDVQRLNQQIDSQRHKNNQLETRLTASSERLEMAQKEADKVAQLSQSLRAKEHEASSLKHDLEKLRSRVAATDELKQQLSSKSSEAAALKRENEALRAEHTRQKAASVDDSAVLTCLQAQVDGLRRENELLKNTTVGADSEKWQAEIDALRSKNNELREKNWKTVEALSATKAEAERSVKQANDGAKAECRELKATIRRLESEAVASQGWQGMAEKAESEKREAEEQLAHYKAALVETETILRDLEQSVETEERKWQTTLQASEQECERARKELANAYSELKKTGTSREDISDLDFAYRCVEKSLTGIVDEMEVKLETTENTLAEVMSERNALTEQLAAAMNELEGASTAAAVGGAEAAKLRAELEKERRTKKELAQQNTKFSALVRIGQDALKEEQDLVKKLQAQLQTQTNGKAQTAS